MELFMIYCTGCDSVIAAAYAKVDSGVAEGRVQDEYFCADCAKAADE